MAIFRLPLFCFLAQPDSLCCFIRQKQGIVRAQRWIAFRSSAAHRAVGTHPAAQVISRIISLPIDFRRANAKTGGTPDACRRNALFAFLVVLRNDARNFLLGLHDLVVEALG